MCNALSFYNLDGVALNHRVLRDNADDAEWVMNTDCQVSPAVMNI